MPKSLMLLPCRPHRLHHPLLVGRFRAGCLPRSGRSGAACEKQLERRQPRTSSSCWSMGISTKRCRLRRRHAEGDARRSTEEDLGIGACRSRRLQEDTGNADRNGGDLPDRARHVRVRQTAARCPRRVQQSGEDQRPAVSPAGAQRRRRDLGRKAQGRRRRAPHRVPFVQSQRRQLRRDHGQPGSGGQRHSARRGQRQR